MNLQAPRTTDYLVLAACERLHLREREFAELSYDDQLRYLAFHCLRTAEQFPQEKLNTEGAFDGRSHRP